MSHETMDLTLHVWRQAGHREQGKFVTYREEARGISEHMSFLEMLDVVNEQLIVKGQEPIAFDHDCREGICGMCGVIINGVAHGPEQTTACQLHMRTFKERGITDITIEPWRATAFPVIRDLVVNRYAFDLIIQSGGYISVSTGSAQDANALPIPKEKADLAMDGAACIGCGACVAACPNASAMLFTSAKIGHLGLLPQGQPERNDRVIKMVNTMDKQGFGGCTNIGECSAVCPKEIGLDFIARMNRDLIRATFVKEESAA